MAAARRPKTWTRYPREERTLPVDSVPVFAWIQVNSALIGWRIRATAAEYNRSVASRCICPGIFRTGVKTENGSAVWCDRDS